MRLNKIVAGDVTINLSGQAVKVQIELTEHGNLVINGIGSNVCYEMYGEELVLMRMALKEDLN